LPQRHLGLKWNECGPIAKTISEKECWAHGFSIIKQLMGSMWKKVGDYYFYYK
jgi:hypothetical protein